MFGIWVPDAAVDGAQAKFLKEAGAVEIKATH